MFVLHECRTFELNHTLTTITETNVFLFMFLVTDQKRRKGELEANQLSLEAAKKEHRIIHLTLRQKDAEIERLKELTR